MKNPRNLPGIFFTNYLPGSWCRNVYFLFTTKHTKKDHEAHKGSPMPWWRTDRNDYIAQVAVLTYRNHYPTTLVGVSPTGTIMIFYISGVFANGISFLLLRFITLVGVSPTGTIIIFCLRGVFANGISFLLLRFCETLLRHKFNCEELD